MWFGSSYVKLLLFLWFCVFHSSQVGALDYDRNSTGSKESQVLLDQRRAYDWTSARLRVFQVLNRSIEFYAKEIKMRDFSASNLLREYLQKSGAVWIVDGKLYVHENFLKGEKGRLHLRFMESILSDRKWRINERAAKYLEQLKNEKKIVYSFSTGSTGELPFDCIPTFVIAKKHPHPRGILFPNPYFNNLSTWDDEMSYLMSIADKKYWNSRIHRVFWRGQLTSREMTNCESCSGRFARLSASVLTVTNPNLFDVRATSCLVRWNPTFCADVYNYTQSEIEALGDCTPLNGEFVPHENFSDYSMFLDLPGGSRGSYSRNLNHLWLVGGVVFIWTGPMMLKDGAEQWYSPALKDKHTHRVIDRETAKFTVLDVLNNPEERKYLVANARGVARRFLCADCLVEYALTALMGVEHHIPALSTLLNHPSERQAGKIREILKEICQKEKWVRVEGLDPDFKKQIVTSDGQELCEKLAPPLDKKLQPSLNESSLFP